jgi:hypothetical protein
MREYSHRVWKAAFPIHGKVYLVLSFKRTTNKKWHHRSKTSIQMQNLLVYPLFLSGIQHKYYLSNFCTDSDELCLNIKFEYDNPFKNHQKEVHLYFNSCGFSSTGKCLEN